MAERPTISVIIPIAPNGECEASLTSVRNQQYDQSKIQILVAVGLHRSIQRNTALLQATGDLIWFMDNDVTISDPYYLERMVAHYADEQTASVGGPSLTPASDSLFQRCVGAVLGSFLATQSVRARYRPIGSVRLTNERELILCSQTFRRAFIHPKGFDERLHSGNEENELMNRLDRSGRKLYYDPNLVVYRSQRSTLKTFVMQMGKYGKSRMEHFLIKPAAFELLFLVPLVFLLYLCGLPLLLLPGVPPVVQVAGILPGIAYVGLAIVSGILAGVRTRSLGIMLGATLLFPVVHLGYAAGSLFALFRRVVREDRKMPPVEVFEIRGPENRASDRRPWNAYADGGATFAGKPAIYPEEAP